ncbi:hypothetical protein [Streptomyces sp. NPDC050564]|uniref:hypothetical protein n=1 Tax=Streptomyces sp. NPDC050564 TaxID=3365631 RepID=UPI003792887A
MSLEDYEWPHEDFEHTAREAGFTTVQWSPVRTPPPDKERDEAFWRASPTYPVSTLMTCTEPRAVLPG